MLKNYKKFISIFTIILILFIAISAISASENDSKEFLFDNSHANMSVLNIEDNEDSVVNENSNNYALNQSTDKIISADDNNYSKEDSKSPKRIYESTHVQSFRSTQHYSSGNIVYKVKIYDIVSYDGIRYKEPKYYHAVKLRVYTGGNYKVYSGVIGYDGVASIKIPNLSIGNHHVEVYYNNSLKATSTIKIIKSSTRIYAPAKTITHKKNTFYKIKVLDSHGNPVKRIVLKVKIFTDKKSKVYSIKTNNKGVVKLKTKSLDLGKHKLIIKTKNRKYKISKTTNIIILKNVPKKAEKLSVSAPPVTVKYKQKHYYQITVKNSYIDPIKKLFLKVKVTNSKKSKTYSIKTNSKGIAKLQTNKLNVGTHKISITTKNKNYRVSKSSKIIVKKKIVPKSGEPTKLKSLTFSPYGDNYSAKLIWVSKAGTSYQVLKKTGGGEYEVLATVKANSGEASYSEILSKGVKATYSVRELIQKSNGNFIGAHDNGGLTLIDSPNVNVDFQNLKAIIKWSKINKATKYKIFRKVGHNGAFKCIGVVDGKQNSYEDWYYKSYNDLKDILHVKKFIDPSYNNLFYTVRACNIKEVDNFRKVSYGLYLKDGDFNLESPSIISLKNNTITWSTVPNAEGYIILKKSENNTIWKKIAQSDASSSEIKSLTIGEIDNTSYYAVQAFATKNGVEVFSNFDKGFTLKYYSKNNSNNSVLFIGDSITFGSPYYSKSTIHIFSMPYRISQLTGCVYYNPSIPGSTYYENTHKTKYGIIRDVIDPISVGELPGNCYHLDSAKNSEGKTNTKLSDYNVVVLLAGTNDYMKDAPLGHINDISTHTFNGGLNYIMGKIKEASNLRESNNQTPIKVVFVGLFYSDRTNNYLKHDRDITPNKIGLTLMDYQKALDKQLKKWSNSIETIKFNTRDYGIVTSKNSPYTTFDNLHFSKFTYGQYGNVMAEFFAKYVFT